MTTWLHWASRNILLNRKKVFISFTGMHILTLAMVDQAQLEQGIGKDLNVAVIGHSDRTF